MRRNTQNKAAGCSPKSERSGMIGLGSRKVVAMIFVLLVNACVSSVPSPRHVRTPARVDPANPIPVGGDYYPLESRRLHEQGECRVKVRVDETGDVHDPEIVRSTGFLRLDRACVASLRESHLLPATEDGKPVESMAIVPIVWILSTYRESSNPVLEGELPGLSACASVRIRKLPPITNAALFDAGLESINVMLELAVDSDGFITDFAVLKSSGSVSIDEQAIVVARRLRLPPAFEDGAPVASCARLAVASSSNK